MTTIVLHGDLQQFGGPFEWQVTTPAAAVRALCAQIKGFRKRLGEGHFRIIRRHNDIERDVGIEAFATRMRIPHALHIVPVAAGSNKGGTKALIGIGIVAAAFGGAGIAYALGDSVAGFGTAFSETAFSIPAIGGVSFAQIAGFGATMLLGGVAGLLSPSPSLQPQVENPGGLFGGPANVTEQGSAIPLVYGRFICGSVCISSALDAEQVPVGTIE